MGRKIIKKNTRKRLAISEIILLITGIVAFSCLLGNTLPIASAYEGEAPSEETPPSSDVTKGFSLKQIPPSLPIIGGFSLAKKYIIPGTPAATGTLGGDLGPAINIPKPVAGFEPGATAGEGFFGKIWNRLTNPKIKSGPIIFAGIAVGVIATYTFISTWIKTGDAGRAAEAALRVGVGAGVGAGAGYLVYAIIGGTGPAGWIIGAGMVLGALFSSWLKREQDRQIDFTCKPWQAKSGGANCESCNDKDFPCTEYQCRSLGTGCEVINKDTDEPRCIHKDPKDVNAPVIQPWEDALIEGYDYVPLPPVEGTGVEIKYTGEECLPFFQPFTFGIKLDKDGYCRIEKSRTSDFSEMTYDFGGKNLYMKEHTQQMTFPGVVHLEKEAAEGAINLTVDGEYEFYVRCEAATNGKANRDEFIFKFCIDPSPDTTSPIIRDFSLPDKTPIAYFEEGEPREVDIQAYVNEPAQCKWSHEDKSYENMENNMTCPNSITNFNAQLSYTCTGKLTGLENSQQNKFFFRCNDGFGNVNIQSKTLTLVGTQPLVISSVEPNETTIKSSSDSMKVTLEAETSAGYKQGEATCYYSETGTAGSYVVFSDTNSHTHSANIWLGPGDYDFFIRCFDLAGNSDNRQISFTVETDTYAPIVVRVFRDGQNLKIITDEEASCVYDNRDCLYVFDDGIGMTSDGRMHTIIWDPNKNFYIKCRDEFDNKPFPNQCSITVRPFEI